MFTLPMVAPPTMMMSKRLSSGPDMLVASEMGLPGAQDCLGLHAPSTLVRVGSVATMPACTGRRCTSPLVGRLGSACGATRYLPSWCLVGSTQACTCPGAALRCLPEPHLRHAPLQHKVAELIPKRVPRVPMATGMVCGYLTVCGVPNCPPSPCGSSAAPSPHVPWRGPAP